MKELSPFPKVKRPGEYVAFFTMQVPTIQGSAYVYLGCDAYSGFGFNTGVELNENPESILKHVYLLTEHPDFVRHMDKGFTLVLDGFEELFERIDAMIAPINGTYSLTRHSMTKSLSPLKRILVILSKNQNCKSLRSSWL